MREVLQKWHLTTTLLAFWSTINTLLIGPNPTIRHRRVIGISLWSGKNSTSKSHDHQSGSYKKFKNFHSKTTQLSPWQIMFWHFLTKVWYFFKASLWPIHVCRVWKVALSFSNLNFSHVVLVTTHYKTLQTWIDQNATHYQNFNALPHVLPYIFFHFNKGRL